MKLICQWYEPQSVARRDELASVRNANESSGLFTECVYLNGDRRWSYGDFIDYAAEHFSGEPCAIANTDIRFDETASLLEKCCARDRIIALTRWETLVSPRMLGHDFSERFFSGTQDVWGFIGGMIPRIGRDVLLGTIGCEQAFLGEAVLSKCEVFDPALDIRTHHVHAAEPVVERPTTFGFYAYPELSSMTCSGLCLTHEWQPGLDPRTVEPVIVETARR